MQMKSRIKKCHETGFFIHKANNMWNEKFWKTYKMKISEKDRLS